MDKLWTPGKLAEYLELSEQTLANWRSQGCGPVWVKIGGQVRYRDKDIEAFISENTVSLGQ
jgi:predicted site-specific integrase-resolvase